MDRQTFIAALTQKYNYILTLEGLEPMNLLSASKDSVNELQTHSYIQEEEKKLRKIEVASILVDYL